MEKIKRTIDNGRISFSDREKMILSILEELKDNQVVLKLTGELRHVVAFDFQDELVALATVGKDIVVDMEKVTYISNTCQQALLHTQQQIDTMNKGSITIVNVPRDIYMDFERIGLSELLWIEAPLKG